MFRLTDRSMVVAARGRVGSARWRFALAALFAVGAAFVLNSAAAGLSWFLVLCLALAFDHVLGRSYIEARSETDRRNAGLLFVWGCVFSTLLFAAMPLLLAANGGASGRVLAVLMAASSLVSVMLFTFQAPRFMVLTAAPATLVLLAIPFIPVGASPASALGGAIGVGCGVAGFLAYGVRAAVNNAKMAAGWKAANRTAKERQLEAEVKRAEAEEANRAKSEFLAVMTHELRTPLNAVIGYAEIIHEDLQGEGRKELADDAARITASARHLLGLIDQILNLSSMDAGQDGLAPRDTDVRRLAEDCVSAVQDEARANGNRISLRVGAGAERAFIDANKLAVSLAALVSNAVKFTNNGLIAVTVEREEDGDLLVFAVSDTGCGIAPENLARVFMPFTQIDATATRAKGGMGLGLSVALRMAHTLGGDLTAASELGAGSTFTLRVPRRQRMASKTKAAA
ncbi:MAG: sensor histidine kinase [Hyphomonadaceae bacterium]